MKKALSLLLASILLFCLCLSAAAEEEQTLELPVVMVTGARPSMKPVPTRSNSVVPYAVVSWGDTAEAVAQSSSGEITVQDGIAVVKSSTEIEGLSNAIPVFYYIGENGLYQVEAVASASLAAKIEDLTSSAVGKALIAHTDAFFQGEDRYVWNGTSMKLFMATGTTAALRCRNRKGTWRLSVMYYPPEPFDTSMVEWTDGVVGQEAGSDMQYFLASPTQIRHPFTDVTPSCLMYIIRVREYQVKERRIPYFSLCLRYAGKTAPGTPEVLSFVIDGKQYSFTDLTATPYGDQSENLCLFSATIGEGSAPFWEALENAAGPVTMSFKSNPPNSGAMTIDLELTDSIIDELVSGYKLFASANGLSPLALDYASEGEAVLTVTDWEAIASAVPAYTLDSSAVPFTQVKWDAKLNDISKALGVKAEKEGSASVIRSAASIENIGENLPVIYTFRNNKLASVKVTVESNARNDAGFPGTARGKLLANYIAGFIGSHPKKDYTSQTMGMVYSVTDITEMAYGVLKNGNSYDISMEFYPAQKYDAAALKKNSKIASAPGGADIMYYDSDPFYFSHADTYNGRRFTYSCFNWVIKLREYNSAVGRIPCIYYYFTYAGVRNPSSVNQIAFAIDNTVYQFDVIVADKLSKTQFGELTESFGFFIDCNNYVFLERLAKAKKVDVTVRGSDFMLNFDLPSKAKTKMVDGMKNFEKVCGLVDGPLAFGRFSGAPVTIY